MILQHAGHGQQESQSITLDLTSLLEQTDDVRMYRQLELYNYKNNQTITIKWVGPFDKYFEYRTNTTLHDISSLGRNDANDVIRKPLGTWQDMWLLARKIREYSGDDDELYANMVLQVTHQLFYKSTSYTKTPVETLVEGSGDCDSFSVFSAALLKAGGVDSAVFLGYVKKDLLENGKYAHVHPHAMVGISFDEQPDDIPPLTKEYYYVEHNGKRYYLAETALTPVSYWSNYDNITVAMSAGRIPWDEFEVRNAIVTPDATNP